jgi:ribosome-associated protein
VVLIGEKQPEGIQALTSSAPRLQAAKQTTVEDIRAVAESLSKALEDDKAEDLLFIDLQGKSSLADFMIIASGRSGRHVAALADHISQEVKKLTGRTPSVEGMPNADWVLIDTGDVIVHLFRPEVREFYNLEKIWASDSPHMRSKAH